MLLSNPLCKFANQFRCVQLSYLRTRRNYELAVLNSEFLIFLTREIFFANFRLFSLITRSISKMKQDSLRGIDPLSSSCSSSLRVCTLPTIHQDRTRVNKRFSRDSSSEDGIFSNRILPCVQDLKNSLLLSIDFFREEGSIRKLGEYQKIFSSSFKSRDSLVWSQRIRGYVYWDVSHGTDYKSKSKSHNFNILEFDDFSFDWSIICTNFKGGTIGIDSLRNDT